MKTTVKHPAKTRKIFGQTNQTCHLYRELRCCETMLFPYIKDVAGFALVFKAIEASVPCFRDIRSALFRERNAMPKQVFKYRTTGSTNYLAIMFRRKAWISLDDHERDLACNRATTMPILLDLFLSLSYRNSAIKILTSAMVGAHLTKREPMGQSATENDATRCTFARLVLTWSKPLGFPGLQEDFVKMPGPLGPHPFRESLDDISLGYPWGPTYETVIFSRREMAVFFPRKLPSALERGAAYVEDWQDQNPGTGYASMQVLTIPRVPRSGT
ncbi:uncharacterized protein ARMOST_20517 [Armillaria ostoyae]|uniref:Uncharacterized protein n=1 Tax=Armillaria ostoyae TaxID=47428 RepID=A0A284S7J3_ARMOS|nr:uncharacterized protein ARMOST_20517 [Armillaria ostoyae]